jgi:hypothetical protein
MPSAHPFYIQSLQSGPITIATGADDFTAPVAIVILIANHNSDGTVLKFSPTSPTRTHAH